MTAEEREYLRGHGESLLKRAHMVLGRVILDENTEAAQQLLPIEEEVVANYCADRMHRHGVSAEEALEWVNDGQGRGLCAAPVHFAGEQAKRIMAMAAQKHREGPRKRRK